VDFGTPGGRGTCLSVTGVCHGTNMQQIGELCVLERKDGWMCRASSDNTWVKITQRMIARAAVLTGGSRVCNTPLKCLHVLLFTQQYDINM
jgi:hypothetical protein